MHASASLRRRCCGAAVVSILGSVLLAPTALAQDGPGYGGTADKLDVSWVERQHLVAMGPGSSIELAADNLALGVSGLGFRGRSEVVVTVGTNDPVTARVDPTGTLDVSVGLERLDAGPQPGTSVVVLGRGPSGTSRTLVGAVPPLPSGFGPADVVPWLLAGSVAAAAVVLVRRRRGDRGNAVASDQTSLDAPAA